MTFRLLALIFTLFAPLAAQASDPLAGVVSHRVLPGWAEPDGSYMAGLEIVLAPGWKTYWRSPGDAGIPPSFDWRRARNVGAVKVHWPSPTVFHEAGLRSIGYKQSVVLPLSIAPRQAGQEIRLRGRMELGICADICIPAALDIDATLPAGPGTRNPQIVAALASLPYSEREAGVNKAVCTISAVPDGLKVSAAITMPPAGGDEAAVIEPGAPGIWVSEAETSRRGNVLTVSAEMMHHSGKAFALNRSDIRITVLGGSYSVDIQGCTGG
jgi:DsbC/DsbD-like thiol-disulfide interchange protein